MQLCLKKNFISVDVADPGQEGLVEEPAFEPAAPAIDKPLEGMKVEAKRLGTKIFELRRSPGFRRLQAADKPEFPHIPETKLSLRTSEGNHQAGVFIKRRCLRAKQKLAGHLEMKKERKPVPAIENDHLAPAPQANEAGPLESFQPGKSAVPDERRE
jgi:hypothetical protein